MGLRTGDAGTVSQGRGEDGRHTSWGKTGWGNLALTPLALDVSGRQTDPVPIEVRLF